MNDLQARSNDEQRIGTTFSRAELSEIDDWGFARKIRSRSEVIRRLVREGLEKGMPAPAGE